MKIQQLQIADLTPDPHNARRRDDRALQAIAASLGRFGQQKPIVVSSDGVVLAGNGTLAAARLLGWDQVDVVRTALTGDEARAYAVADNRTADLASWDEEVLARQLAEWDGDLQVAAGYDQDEVDALLRGLGGDDGGATAKVEARLSLADRFLVPPFSVLNTREGWWQDRKRAWIATGIQSEVGRSARAFGDAATRQKNHVGGGLLIGADSGNDPAYYEKKKAVEARLGRTLTRAEFQADHYEGPDSYESGISIFDPVLCELVYRWWSGAGATVLDPFAGGSVRGIVAGALGRRYHGMDLSAEQVEANRDQVAGALPDGGVPPTWEVGDSAAIGDAWPGTTADLLFSCPPYGDLEVYSDDPADLSAMDWDGFMTAYRAIIAASCARLADDRFAVFVVGDLRDRQGNYRNLPGETVAAFQDAGLSLYGEAILVNQVGSLAVRVAKQWTGSRKLGKTHQTVLVFVKGDAKAATAAAADGMDAGDLDAALMAAEAAAGD